MKPALENNYIRIGAWLLITVAYPFAAHGQVIAPRYEYKQPQPVQAAPAPAPVEMAAAEPAPVPSVGGAPAPVAVGKITYNAAPEAAEEAPVKTTETKAPAPAPAPVAAPAQPAPATPMPVWSTPETGPAAPVPPVTETQETLAREAKKAAPQAMVVAAGQGGGQHSSYGTAGVITAWPGSTLGNGWVSRVFAEEMGYRYRTGGRTIDGTALGGSVTFGYQHSYADGWLGTYAGVAYRHTHLSPDDAGSDARGNNTAFRLQGEGEQFLTPDFKLNANAVGDFSSNTSYWGRLRALYRVSGDIFAGPEGSYQGDHDYKAWEGGLAVVGVPVTDKSSLGMDAGVRKAENVPITGYAGLEFGAAF